jgi:sensor histidine kinase YesM
MRFNERFDYKIQCDPNIDTEMIIIPAMMIQPFIENSIIHGILPNDEVKGFIEVSIDLKGNVLVVTIDDNGVGVEASMKNRQQDRGDHQSKGTEITFKRIELLKKLTSQEFELVGPVQIYHSDRSIKGTRVTLKFYIENLD